MTLLRIVRGTPSDEEVAALTVVVAAAASRAADVAAAPRPRSAWGDPARRLRPGWEPGPGAWRASALPR